MRCLGRYWFTAPHSDSHFHTRPEPVDDRHEAIDCEPPEAGIANAREVGRRNPGATVRRAYAQTVAVEHLDDFSGQDGLELLGIGIIMPEAAKNISAAPHYLQSFSFHRSIPFNLFRRALIRSISRCGVLVLAGPRGSVPHDDEGLSLR